MVFSFVQYAGAVPFSSFLGGKKRTKRRSNKRRSNKKTNKRTKRIKKKSQKRTSRIQVVKGKCKCDKELSGDSPDGFGYCAKCSPEGIVMKGKDGNLWENKGDHWILIRKDMSGGRRFSKNF